MNITKVTPRGYCKGVVRAINIAKQTAKQYPNEDIYILGMLVHNRYIIDALALLGIKTIDDKQKSREELLEEIDHGVVIFTAHGIAKEVKEIAEDKGLICVDASCPDVLRTQMIVDEHRKKGYEIFYIGKKGHPEAASVCEYDEHVHLIETQDDVKELQYYEHILVTNQTTMSLYDVQAIFDEIKKDFPHAEFVEEICDATRSRQEAIYSLNGIDTLLIVGDINSNNSKRLAQIGREKGIQNVHLIENVNDLSSLELHSNQNIAVSAGASTPTYLTNQVLQALEDEDYTYKEIPLQQVI